jgi:hypothetical protein
MCGKHKPMTIDNNPMISLSKNWFDRSIELSRQMIKTIGGILSPVLCEFQGIGNVKITISVTQILSPSFSRFQQNKMFRRADVHKRIRIPMWNNRPHFNPKALLLGLLVVIGGYWQYFGSLEDIIN